MSRKLVAVRISPKLIESWMISTGEECIFHSIDGVPKGSKMVDMRYNFQEGIYQALFTHHSFEPVELGQPIPVITPRITTYRV